MILRRVTTLVADDAVPNAAAMPRFSSFDWPNNNGALPRNWTPGICHHDAHVVHDGVRLGLLFLDDDLASVLPCLHNSKDGT